MARVSSAFETKAPSKRAQSLLRTLEDVTPRGRSFRYSQEEFLADVFGPGTVPQSKPPKRPPSKAWNAPPLSDLALAKVAERSDRADESAKDKALRLKQQQQAGESLTEEQQLKAYELKAAGLLMAVKAARAEQQLSKRSGGEQQLRQIGLGPPHRPTLHDRDMACAEQRATIAALKRDKSSTQEAVDGAVAELFGRKAGLKAALEKALAAAQASGDTVLAATLQERPPPPHLLPSYPSQVPYDCTC